MFRVYYGKLPTSIPLYQRLPPPRNNLFHISGTDIVRCLAFRFQAFGRPVKNSKKFEEGIFSDLRNLKSGTDASLEEPKSPFLDFLYKNNCIRTQKKQKVFYWYSVPHDRLFLDALERDLKREKMGQEATTVAVSEPALSFEFDSSVSLFDQLTKAQQTNNSLYQGGGHPQSQPQSPSMRAQDSMPPPQMIPQQPQLQHSMHQTMPEEISVTQVPTYTQMAMPPMNPMPPLPAQVQKTREQSLGPVVQYDRNGIPVSQAQYRHSSMPTYMEYSPAPSFVSSHFEDYSTRGLSFEPITPPQHSVPNGNEAAYIANEDTGLYTAIPDLGMSLSYNPLMQMPPTSLPGPQYPSMIRPIQQSYPVLEGSPSYKQRRRRSSLSQGIAAAVTASGGVLNTPHAPHRPSDLRRSVSQTLMPMAETDESFHDSPTSVHNSQPIMSRHKELLELSHQSNDVAGMHPQMPMSQAEDFAPFNTSDEYKPMNLHHAAVHRTANGVYRRARSATISELGPYPHKSHSCPIPMCGRLFKRLEHLKRYVEHSPPSPCHLKLRIDTTQTRPHPHARTALHLQPLRQSLLALRQPRPTPPHARSEPGRQHACRRRHRRGRRPR